MELIARTDAGNGISLAQYEFPTTEEGYAGIVRAQLPSGKWHEAEFWLVDATYSREWLMASDADNGPGYWASVGTNGHAVHQDSYGDHIEIDGTLYIVEWRDYSGTGEVA